MALRILAVGPATPRRRALTRPKRDARSDPKNPDLTFMDADDPQLSTRARFIILFIQSASRRSQESLMIFADLKKSA